MEAYHDTLDLTCFSVENEIEFAFFPMVPFNAFEDLEGGIPDENAAFFKEFAAHEELVREKTEIGGGPAEK